MNLENLSGETLFSYLHENKEDILSTRKSSFGTSPLEVAFSTNTTSVTPVDKTTLDVKVVCSTSWVFNGNFEVITDSAYTDSITARGTSIPHIVDHWHSATAFVGDTKAIYTEQMPVRTLGADSDQVVTALIMESTVRQDYNPEVFKFYANGKINQHSIGYRYDEVKLAINSSDPELKEEKAVWDANYPKIVNKAALDKYGFFILVEKLDILENSAVLFGANSLTPTLSIASLFSKNVRLDESLKQLSIGKTMTLEEAQGKIISLTEELTAAKSAITVARLEAAKTERDRVLNILKAQATFGTEAQLQKAALTAVEKGIDLDMAVVTFEMIKEGIQSANAVDTSTVGLTLSQIEEKQSETAKDFFLRTAAAATTNNESIRSML